MIHLHTWKTPNGRKISIALEEFGVPYRVVPIDLGQNQQTSPEFLKLSPNGKIPAIVDDEVLTDGKPLSIFESGAVLTYLADKHGRFLARSGPARWKTLEWLFWQVGGLGPMLGQYAFFAMRSTERSALAIDRFTTEAHRLLGVADKRLAEARFFAGAEYTIADMALYPWIQGFAQGPLKDVLAAHVALSRWLGEVGQRPAVSKGMTIPA